MNQKTKNLFILLSFVIAFVGCNDKSYEDLRREMSSSKTVDPSYKVYKKSELTGAPFSAQISASIARGIGASAAGKTKTVGFKENEQGRGIIDWVNKTDWKNNPPIVVFRFINNDARKIFYVKSSDSNQTVNFEQKNDSLEMKFSLNANLPPGVTDLNGWSISCFIADNVQLDENNGTITFGKTNNQRVLEPLADAQLNIPFASQEVSLSSVGNSNVKLNGKMDIKPLGTLLTLDIQNGLIDEVDPDSVYIRTNLFTDAGSFTWEKSPRLTKLSDRFSWQPEEGQYSFKSENEQKEEYFDSQNSEGESQRSHRTVTYLDLSKELPYALRKHASIPTSQKSKKYVMWVMPTPLGFEIDIDYRVKDKIIGTVNGYEKGFTWTNSNPKVGLMSDAFGKTIHINAQITGDLMITEVYFNGKDLIWTGGNQPLPDSYDMCGMVEIYNPTNRDIPLKNYYISRIHSYVISQYEKDHGKTNDSKVTTDYPQGGAPERDNGGPGFNVHPYGYYPRGNNWNNYGINPYVARYFTPNNIAENTVDYTALLQCLDVTAEKISHTILGDQELTVRNKRYEPLVDHWGLWGYYHDDNVISVLRKSAQAVLLKGNPDPKPICEYIFPVRYKLHPHYKNLPQSELQVLHPGKTAVFCAAYYRTAFIEGRADNYPEKTNLGLSSLGENINNGKCQFVVSVDNSRYYYSYYDVREQNFRSYSNSGSVTNSDQRYGNFGSTLNIGWKNGLRLTKRVLFRNKTGGAFNVGYRPVDLFGPSNVITPNQRDMVAAWKSFTVGLLPYATRWDVRRKPGVRTGSSRFERRQWEASSSQVWNDNADQARSNMGAY